MATAGAIRKSDRLKEKDEKEDYALPPPLQQSENKKIAVTSTPVKRSMEEEELDKQLELIEKSICETESQLQEIDHQKKLQEKKAKLERLQKQLSRNERKIKKETEEGEVSKSKVEKTAKCSAKQSHKSTSDIQIKDLKSNGKLRKKAQQKLLNLGLYSESDVESVDSSSDSTSTDLSDSSSDSSSKRRSSKKKKSHLNSDSSSSDSEFDRSDSGHKKSKKKKKKSKKSGMAKRASDKVKNPQIWPHSKLQYEFVSENISFKKLDFNMFIAGELEILTSKISKTEYKGRIRLLKKIVYYSKLYDWKCLLKFYAAWLRRIETGLNSWGDDSSQIETAMLSGHATVKRSDKGYLPKSEQVWWCSDFNRDKCTFGSSTHQKSVKGHLRQVKHICGTCWRNDKKQLQHPETSAACPYKI